MLHPEIRRVLIELEQATHTRGALFVVRDGEDPWAPRWASGATHLLAIEGTLPTPDPTSWWQSVHEDDRARLRDALARGRPDCVLEYRMAASGGAPLRVRESSRRVVLPEGDVVLVSIVRDISLPQGLEPARSDLDRDLLQAGGGAGSLVLLVEDDEAVRSLLARVLAREGFSTLLAGDVREALKVLEWAPRPPEVLVTDVVLPDRTGPELARLVRTGRSPVPVLYISGYGPDELERRGDLPTDGPLLSKPFTPAEFISAIRGCLGLQTRRKGGGGAVSGPEQAAS